MKKTDEKMPTDAYCLFQNLVVDSWQMVNQRQRAKAQKYNDKLDKKKDIQKLIQDNVLTQMKYDYTIYI